MCNYSYVVMKRVVHRRPFWASNENIHLEEQLLYVNIACANFIFKFKCSLDILSGKKG